MERADQLLAMPPTGGATVVDGALAMADAAIVRASLIIGVPALLVVVLYATRCGPPS
jgi:hypothetical protein